MINSEVEKIISLARDKYAVHECSECTYRKCCDLYNGFGSAECLSRRVSIFLMLGIEDSFFTKLLDDIEAAWRREKAEIEANALAVGGVVEAARHKPGNAAAMRESESVFPRGDYEAMRAALMRVESEMIGLINAEGSRVPFQPRAILDDVEHVLKNLGGAKC